MMSWINGAGLCEYGRESQLGGHGTYIIGPGYAAVYKVSYKSWSLMRS